MSVPPLWYMTECLRLKPDKVLLPRKKSTNVTCHSGSAVAPVKTLRSIIIVSRIGIWG